MKKKTKKRLAIGGMILGGLALAAGVCIYRVRTAKGKYMGNLLATEENPDPAVEIKAGKVYELRTGEEYIGEEKFKFPIRNEEDRKRYKSLIRDSYLLADVKDSMLKSRRSRKARLIGDNDGVKRDRVIPDRDWVKLFTDNEKRDFEGMKSFVSSRGNNDNKVFCELPGEEDKLMLRKKFNIPKIIWTGVKSIYGYVKVVGK